MHVDCAEVCDRLLFSKRVRIGLLSTVLPTESLKTVELFIALGLGPFFVSGATSPPSPQWARARSFTRFLDHTQRRNTVDRVPLPDNTRHLQQTSMHPGGIRTHDLSRRAAVDPRLRPPGHRNLLLGLWVIYFLFGGR